MMRLARFGLAVRSLSICLLIGLAACSSPKTPPAPPRAVLDLKVDADAAFVMVKEQVELGNRVAGTPEAEATSSYIAGKLKEFGYVPEVDAWEEATDAGPKSFRNVYAEREGPMAGFILLGSHYDVKLLPGEKGFQGANDAASSTGLLLEIMRVLQQTEEWPGPTVRCAFFDGEEAVHGYTERDGLHGSKRLAASYQASGEAKECHAMILLDMVGDADLKLTLSSDDDPTLLALVLSTAEAQGARQHVGFFSRGGILDDHVPFKRIGIPAVDLIDFEYGPTNSYWHSRHDTLDKVSPKSLDIIGNLVLRMIQDIPERKPSP